MILLRLGTHFSTPTLSLPAPSNLPKFDFLNTVCDKEIHKAIMKSPTNSCLLDSRPTFLVKECLDIIVPSISKLVMCSLSEGVVPSGLKKAVINTIIKNPHYHLAISKIIYLRKA